jgi:hypothetical protein
MSANAKGTVKTAHNGANENVRASAICSSLASWSRSTRRGRRVDPSKSTLTTRKTRCARKLRLKLENSPN